MQEFIPQLFTLFGVALGAAGTYGVTALTERKRWARQQAARWDERRVVAYREYASILKKVISISMGLAQQRGVPTGVHAMAPDYQLADLAAAEEERAVCWEGVLLFGSDDAIRSGRQWHDCVFRLELLAAGHASDVSWDVVIQQVSRARGEFYRVLRKDIGVSVLANSDHYDWQVGAAPWQAGVSPQRSETADQAGDRSGR
ncbi:hypothetical protein [Micromonospora sp. NPDC049645]|uniref:hypothetical protein n=1 Tax=Micromonospora sp. NPDC049645 TaxID=3155508 RepID=UPI00343EF848